jgi:hypothetical protein
VGGVKVAVVVFSEVVDEAKLLDEIRTHDGLVTLAV